MECPAWRPTDFIECPAWPSASSAPSASSSLLPPSPLLQTYNPLPLAHVPAPALLPDHGHGQLPADQAPFPHEEGLPAPYGAAAAADEYVDYDQEPAGAGGQEIVDDLPMGYRFCPTDRVLVLEYLLNKVLGRPTPADIILDIGDIYKFDADQLPWMFMYPMKGECYFYTRRTKKYPNGSRPSRSTPSGYWKATGRDTDVVRSKDGVVGTRKSLVFYFGRSPAPGQKTNWIMHEYRISRLSEKLLGQCSHHADPELQWDSYVLCKVYKKEEPRNKGPREYELWAGEGNTCAHDNPVLPSCVDAQF